MSGIVGRGRVFEKHLNPTVQRIFGVWVTFKLTVRRNSKDVRVGNSPFEEFWVQTAFKPYFSKDLGV